MATVRVELENRDHLEIEFDTNTGGAMIRTIRAYGCLELLTKVELIRSMLPKQARDLFLYNDHSHSSLLLNEALLKSLNQWKYPYQADELCHCRAVPTKKVDAAIVAGFHTVEEIAEQTSAGTACGNCRVDSQACIEYRLNNKS